MKYFVKATIRLRMCVATLPVIFVIIITGCDEVGPIVVDATSPPPEWEQWYGGIAGKWYGDVDDWAVTRPIGNLLQPSVRLIYFLPSDREIRQERAEALCQMVTDVQAFYADEMERHGFGRKTFALETDAGGLPVVHFIRGEFKDEYYYEHSTHKILKECFEYINDPRHIYFIVIDNGYESLREGTACGTGAVTYMPAGDREGWYHQNSIRTRIGGPTEGETALGGVALIPASGFCFFNDGDPHSHQLRTPTHELAHAFGLRHDFGEDNHQWVSDNKSAVGGTGHQFSHCDAEWLSVSRFFNAGPFPEDSPGSVTLLPTPEPISGRVHTIRFQVEDPDGLHQAQLLVSGPYRISSCKQLDGSSNTIEFAVQPEEQIGEVTLQIIDKRGGIAWATFLMYWQ